MTNRQLAKLLGVSPATLSLILNNKPGISAATRARVLRQLEEQGLSSYVKAKPAASASSNLCFVVYKRHGLILDSHPFFLLLMESIEACARQHGYNLLFLSMDRRSPVDGQIQRLSAMDIKGVILFATEMLEEDIEYFRGLTIPYVVLDNDFPLMNMDTVAINNQLGTYQAVEYLARMGHAQIGYLQSGTYINSFGEREAGYRQAMKRLGLALDPQYVFRLNFSEEGSREDFRALLAKGARLPTALFSDDDTIAAGAIKALSEKGIRVPQDLSVMGFNDRPAYAGAHPALSTIRVPKYAFGAMAIDLLVKRIDDESLLHEGIRSFKYRIGTELVIRDSVSPR